MRMALLSKNKLIYIDEAVSIPGKSEIIFLSGNDAITWYFLGSLNLCPLLLLKL